MSGEADTFMPLYVGDYIADTMELTTLEHGAYLLLLFHYWRTSAPLPSGDETLARITRLSRSQWDGMSARVRKFFREVDQDGEVVLTHKRVENEMARAKSKYESRKSASEKANAAKAAAGGEANGQPQDVVGRRRRTTKTDRDGPQPEPEPHFSSSNEEEKTRGRAREDGAPRFEEWLRKLHVELGSEAYWLSGAQLLEDDDGLIHVTVPKKVQADKLKAAHWLKLDRVFGEGKYAVDFAPPELSPANQRAAS